MRIQTLLVAILAVVVDAQGDQPATHSCALNEHWVRAHSRRAYTKADGTRVRANPPGFAIWFPLMKDGAPPEWPLDKEVPKSWSEEERERTLEALSVLPKQLVLDGIKGIYRMGKSVSFPNTASGDRKGNTILYDNAFDEGQNLSQILAHEFSHRLFVTLSNEDVRAYLSAAGWADTSPFEKGQYVLMRKNRVAFDSGDGVEEDFSNNIEYFLFKPMKLKEVSPEGYRWIENHFGGTFKLGKGSP